MCTDRPVATPTGGISENLSDEAFETLHHYYTNSLDCHGTREGVKICWSLTLLSGDELNPLL
jgi:hypothetical protein